MESSLIIFAAFIIFFLVSIGVILILWIVMPFSVFGLKDLIKKSIEEQEKTNRLLQSLIDANISRENIYKGREDFPENRNTH